MTTLIFVGVAILMAVSFNLGIVLGRAYND